MVSIIIITFRHRTNIMGRKRRGSVSSSSDRRSTPRLWTLYPSSRPEKKFDVFIPSPKTGNIIKISFGAKGYSDYTQHHDKQRRERYRKRHSRDRIHDITKPACWSWYLLWGDSIHIKTNLKSLKKMMASSYDE